MSSIRNCKNLWEEQYNAKPLRCNQTPGLHQSHDSLLRQHTRLTSTKSLQDHHPSHRHPSPSRPQALVLDEHCVIWLPTLFFILSWDHLRKKASRVARPSLVLVTILVALPPTNPLFTVALEARIPLSPSLVSVTPNFAR